MQDIQQEPIAIVGMGCRFPGAESPRAFWKLLCEGKDAIREVPVERWDTHALYDRDLTKPGKMASRWGGFLDQVDQFDWRTFRVPPHEAKYMDPQHRLLLEVAWEALEDAGLPFEKVAGSRTGVFIGISWNDYLRLQARDWSQINGYMATGGSALFASSRLSYFFDLRGPSFSTDVGCISSLASLYLACQSLWNHETEMALAGGVNLILSPDITLMVSKAGLLAADGRCKTLDAQADGFVRGEGAGILILKRLSQVEPTDRVYSVIRSLVVNHNGHNSWITASSQSAQELLLEEAYCKANLDPATVDYVELHGTGFLKGDSVESTALGAIIGVRPERQYPCLIGSVKTNIGHLESAGSVAAVIKVALSLYHQQIPPTLHLEAVNPAIDVQKLQLEPVLTLREWPHKEGNVLRVAGVTSLAMSGANAHAVLTSGPGPTTISTTLSEETNGESLLPQLLPLSATSPQSLLAQASAWCDFLLDEEITRRFSWRDICYTASVRRSHHPYRLFVVGQTPQDAAASLQSFLQREETSLGIGQGKNILQDQKMVWVFSHHLGAPLSWPDHVYWHDPSFRKIVAECEQVYKEMRGYPLVSAGADFTSTDLEGEMNALVLHLEIAGRVYTAGYNVNWSAFYPDARCCVSLPPYAWHREHLWFETTSHQDNSLPADTSGEGANSDLASPLSDSAGVLDERPELLTQLLETPKEKRAAFLQGYLTMHISDLVGYDPGRPLSPTQGFFDAGMRSVTATHLANHLQVALDCSLPQILVFNYPTIESLCEYLLTRIEQEHLAGKQETDQRSELDAATEPLTAVGSLSGLDTVTSLLAKLADIERKFS